MNDTDPAVTAGFAKTGIETARRHVFLCPGPKCCTLEEGLATWDTIKSLVKTSPTPALRSKADCLRICAGGPWMIVYPEGTWYGRVTPERCARIMIEHVEGGHPIAEWIARTHPLCGGCGGIQGTRPGLL